MIDIVEVKTKKQLKEFIEFPNELYKDNKYYIPSFFSDEKNHLDYKKNPIRDYSKIVLYLAYKENEIVGRIAGIINYAFNKDKNVKQARFTRIDMIDDIEVTKALINSIEAWAKDNKMNEVIGPIGFTDLDKQGLLTYGYDELDTFITLYHYPYYKEHLEKLGYTKDAEWKEFLVNIEKIPEEQTTKITKIANLVQEKKGYKILKIKNRFRLFKYGKEMFRVYNEAFSKLYGFQPIPEKVMSFYLWQVIFLVNLKYVWFVVDKNKKVVGFGLLVPSMGNVTKKYNGRLNIFNVFAYLKAIHGKNDRVDLYFIAVKPELQNQGIPALIFVDAIKKLKKYKFKYAETGPELENNHNIINLWQRFNAKNHRKRICYHKYIK